MCGLRIASTIQLPELMRDPDTERDSPPDVELEMGRDLLCRDAGAVVMTRTDPDGSPWLTCFALDGAYRLHFPDHADFIITKSGKRVTCAVRQTTPPETIRHLFLDQVMPLLLNLLNLTGREALHASAVRLPQGVCAFLGESGSGKSTLAAAFHRAGHAVLSDDCLLLRTGSKQVQVEASYPGLRLWADSAEFLFRDAPTSRPVAHYSSKLRVPTSRRAPLSRRSFPLRAIFLLERDKPRGKNRCPRIESRTLRDSVMDLFKFSFRLDLTDRDMILRQMQTLENVARLVPIKRLTLCNDLDALEGALELIVNDLCGG